ncbi:MAG: OB-fold nucleic acid binding domain-containing protein [Silvanigrellaceae bacterium]
MSDSVFEIKKSKFLEQRECGNLADSYPKTHCVEQAMAEPEGTRDVSVAGRIVGLRTMGKILFAHIFDHSGRMQICVRKTEENPEIFETFTTNVAVGDFVGVTGEIFRTKTNELTVRIARSLSQAYRDRQVVAPLA